MSAAVLTRFLRFAAVGAVGTLAHYALLVALVEGAGAPPLAGAVAGFVLGALINYALARRLVFVSAHSHGQALPRFFAVAGAGLAWTALLMTLFVDGLGLHYLAAQILTTAVLLLWHYAGNALWTFRRDHDEAGPR